MRASQENSSHKAQTAWVNPKELPDQEQSLDPTSPVPFVKSLLRPQDKTLSRGLPLSSTNHIVYKWE